MSTGRGRYPLPVMVVNFSAFLVALPYKYKRKQEMYEKVFGFKDLDKIHKKFIEQDITGIDVMPFAAHISTLNLATQNIEQKTNVVRIATQDSLSIYDSLRTEEFKKKGIKISSYTEQIQETLFSIGSRKKVRSRYRGQ